METVFIEGALNLSNYVANLLGAHLVQTVSEGMYHASGYLVTIL